MRVVKLAALAVPFLFASTALAQTLEETVATIFYTAGGGTSSNIKIHQTAPCKFRLDMHSEPIYEVDFSRLVTAEARETNSRTELLLTGNSSLFASSGAQKDRMKTLTIIQNLGTSKKILAAVDHLQKNYCKGG